MNKMKFTGIVVVNIHNQEIRGVVRWAEQYDKPLIVKVLKMDLKALNKNNPDDSGKSFTKASIEVLMGRLVNKAMFGITHEKGVPSGQVIPKTEKEMEELMGEAKHTMTTNEINQLKEQLFNEAMEQTKMEKPIKDMLEDLIQKTKGETVKKELLLELLK